MTQEEYYQAKAAMRLWIRSRDDVQAMRKIFNNRIGRKADGEMQNVSVILTGVDAETFKAEADKYSEHEHEIEKQIKNLLNRFDIWECWLKDIKGVGDIAAGWIIAEIDIYKAETVSKIWQYCGLNPGMVAGKKRVENKDGSYSLVPSDKMIRGDKLEKGFVSPFNKRLRAALLGVTATGFIMCRNEYRLKYYDPYKERLANSEKLVTERAGNGKEIIVEWRSATPRHRDMAAKRYMMKMFLMDLYKEWRPLHGLPVREPYQKEYLGHTHAA